MDLQDGNGSPSTLTVRFEPHHIEIAVPKGATVLDAARRAGIHIETPCGGIGVCGKCKVHFTSGAPTPTGQEIALLNGSEISIGYRLACRSSLNSDAVIVIPQEIEHPVGSILIFGATRSVSVNPLVRKQFIKIAKPSLHDEIGDWERLIAALRKQSDRDFPGRAKCRLDLLRKLSRTLRDSDFEITPVVIGDRLIAVESGDTTAHAYGMAFDIGTTTLVCYLVDLRSGVTLSVASAFNPQVAYGDDIISRIAFAIQNEDGLRMLHEVLIHAINDLVQRACSDAGISSEHVYHVTFVGNTCMIHLLLGLDVAQLGQAPYVPVIQSTVEVEASELGIALPNAIIHVLPCIGGFVGADTVAMILLHLLNGVEVALAIDIGTNSEVVVKRGDEVFAASAAAGPAFEGARIKHGMMASDGAIYSVVVDGNDLRCMVIGDAPAKGICGTGLIDAVATLLGLGVIDESGRIRHRHELPSQLVSIRERIVERDGEVEFVLAYSDEFEEKAAVVLTQRDIRQLQLAKGSIRAATETLLNLSGITHDELQAVYIAGAFGTFIRKESAMRIGLLPPVPLELIHSVGNAAGMGAKLTLINAEELERAEAVARSVRHIELGTSPIYAEAFVKWMRFSNEGVL